MTLNQHGFTVIEMPSASEKLLKSFENLPLDNHCGGNFRYRRFSQYRIHFDKNHWQLNLLPYRPFIQSSKYNKFVGGVTRHYQPLEIDPSLQVDAGAKAIPLDTNIDWQINVHQYRIIASPNLPGICVPEGPHQDGHEYVMIAVFQRHQIVGAELSLLPLGGGNPFYRTTIQEGQAILLKDEDMFHDASDIEAIGSKGYRDIWVVVFDRWEDRRYGIEFEKRALAGL